MKILLADGQSLFREGLRLVLNGVNEDIRIVEAVDFSGTLRVRFPDVPIVVLSRTADQRRVRESIKCGAVGYIPKTVSAKVLIAALNLILSGGVYVPPESLYTDFRSAAADRMLGDGESQPPKLTRRQTDVLGLLAEGPSNKDIGRRLALSVGTVKLHVAALFRKFQANNRAQVAIKAARMGITPSQTPSNFDRK
jgi:DNA-binding NarL/FixJ family response regulator